MNNALLLRLTLAETRQQTARDLLEQRDALMLAQGARHQNPSVRHACLWILDRCEGNGVFGIFPALIDGLEDTHPKVRALAIELLQKRLQRMNAKALLNLRPMCHGTLAQLIDQCLNPQHEPEAASGGLV